MNVTLKNKKTSELIKITYDSCVQNPLEDEFYLGEIIIDNPYFRDKPICTYDLKENDYHGFELYNRSERSWQDCETLDEIEDILCKGKKYYYVELGFTERNCNYIFDSGKVHGFIYCERAKLKKELGKKATYKQAYEHFKNQIETLNKYVNGEVYLACTYDINGEQIDCCGDIYADSIEDIFTVLGLDYNDYETVSIPKPFVYA